jgi:hypothetical protein
VFRGWQKTRGYGKLQLNSKNDEAQSISREPLRIIDWY